MSDNDGVAQLGPHPLQLGRVLVPYAVAIALAVWWLL